MMFFSGFSICVQMLFGIVYHNQYFMSRVVLGRVECVLAGYLICI